MSIAPRHKAADLLLLLLVLGLSAPGRPASAQAGRSQADRLLAEGHYLQAERLIREAVQKSPADAHALSNLSVVDWAFNRLDASIADAEKAVAASPDSKEAHSKLADALGAKLLSSNAGTVQKISLAHRFRKEIDKTLELDPNDVDALQDLAQFLWHAPGMVGGDKQQAKQIADKLFKISPYNGAAARADFVSDESDVDRRNAAVQEIWRSAVAAQPSSYDAHAALATSYLDGNPDASHLASAEAEGKRTLALDSARINAYIVLATFYARAGRWPELEAMLKQAHDRVPDDRTPQYQAAIAILGTNQSEQLQRAEQMLRDYLNQTPEGQAPSHASAHWRLGEVLERQGRKADAIRELQMALQQDGSLDGAKKDLKRLS